METDRVYTDTRQLNRHLCRSIQSWATARQYRLDSLRKMRVRTDVLLLLLRIFSYAAHATDRAMGDVSRSTHRLRSTWSLAADSSRAWGRKRGLSRSSKCADCPRDCGSGARVFWFQ
jgi:hypothetical protein